MKKYNKDIYKILLISAFTMIIPVIAHSAYAEENVPIPPKRPNILNVSPAYIEELRNRATVAPIENDKEENFLNNEKNDVENNVENKIETKIAEINKTDLVNILKQDKPLLENIKPAAGNVEEIKEVEETTLISFALKAKQITLDKNLEIFLKDRAIELFNADKNLKMEIHAYATPIKGEPHSDVRISLARALKVRSFLIDNDVAPNRLKLSPMGKDGDNSNDNRIDLIFIKMN